MQKFSETVNGRRFDMSNLPAVPSFRLWTKLTKQHGASVTKAVAEQDAEALGAVFDSLDLDLIEEVRTTFMAVSLVDGKTIQNDQEFNAAFSGKISDMLAWLKFVLFSEYGHLFTQLGVVIGPAVAEADPDTPIT